MKEILFSNKAESVKFILGSLLQAVFQISYSIAVAILIGMIPEATLPHFWRTVVYVSLVLLSLPLLQIYSRLLRIRYMKEKHLQLRERVFDRIMSLDYRSYSLRSREDYISILTNDMLTFENVFFPTLMTIIQSLGVYFLSFIILLRFDWRLALTVILLSILLYISIRLFAKKSIRKQNQVLRVANEVTVSAGNTLNGLELLKLNNIEDKFLKLTEEKFDLMEDKKMNLNIFTLTQKQFTKFIGSLIFIMIVYYSGHKLLAGGDLTVIALIVGLANNMVWPVTEIIPLVNQIRAVSDSMERHVNLKADNTSTGNRPFSFEDKIEVNNLTYRYGIREIIKDTSFEIKKNKKYLIKGPSGSGKSTLLKILSKSLFNFKGKISVDSVPLDKISDISFSSNVAFIYQDVFLLEDTLRNNITLYKDIPEEEVMEAIRKSGLERFLKNHKDGLETEIMENGKNLSGGERQRISIARALLRNTQLLFVDEATSSLDEEMARRIENTILDTDATVIAITHKFFKGITDRYDYVLELKSGKVNVIDASVYFQGGVL